MKKVLSIGVASLLVAGIMVGRVLAAAENDNAVCFDFEKDNEGFAPIFADYPNEKGVEEFYEFRHAYGKIPIDGAGNGIFLSGNNHSADLFMGYVKVLEGLDPGQNYHFDVSFKLATDVEGGLVGVGGAPGESVAVKCGISTIEPHADLVDEGFGAYYRMNIDVGIQSSGGRDMAVVGDMVKTENRIPGQYEFKKFQTECDAAANERGEVWLMIATDSGFESTTSYYLDDITVKWRDAAQGR